MLKYKGNDLYNKEMEELRSNYARWKAFKKESGSTFFMIYTDFKDSHLKDISGGALKLYVYLCFHVNNFTGECWHSVDSIADFFGNDPRTVKGWFAELEDRKLIIRIQKGYKRIANTFLLPYSKENIDGGKEDGTNSGTKPE